MVVVLLVFAGGDESPEQFSRVGRRRRRFAGHLDPVSGIDFCFGFGSYEMDIVG